MSKLEELIARLCPDGVEYKELGDIATDIYRGAGIKRDEVTTHGTPCVRYGEIYTTYDVWFDTCVSHTDESKIASKKYFEYGDILFAITGESVEDIAKSCAYVGHEKCLAGGDIVVLKHNEDPKYLSYALATLDAKKQKSAGKVKSKVVHSSVPAIKKIKVPVPPLEVQREIVHILDSFTFLTAELTAELAARQKQYEFYRDELVLCPSNTVIVKLSDIAYFYNGDRGKNYPKISEMVSDGIPFVNAGDVNGKVDTINCNKITREKYNSLGGAKLKKNDILYCLRGSTGKNGIYNKEEGTVASSLVAIRVDSSKANFKYIYYLLNSKLEIKQRLKADTGAAQPNLSAQNVKNYEFPLPPLSEQQRIVDILDRFDALCNDITSGLPAEIEARRKQYEYYRDKLLTFKELKKEA